MWRLEIPLKCQLRGYVCIRTEFKTVSLCYKSGRTLLHWVIIFSDYLKLHIRISLSRPHKFKTVHSSIHSTNLYLKFLEVYLLTNVSLSTWNFGNIANSVTWLTHFTTYILFQNILWFYGRRINVVPCKKSRPSLHLTVGNSHGAAT